MPKVEKEMKRVIPVMEMMREAAVEAAKISASAELRAVECWHRRSEGWAARRTGR